MDIPFHTPGTAVRVLDDIARVGELQTVGPGWNDEITLVNKVTSFYLHLFLSCLQDTIKRNTFYILNCIESI